MVTFVRFCCLFIFAACLGASGQDVNVPIYHLQVFAGGWRLTTNNDFTVLATDRALSRIGNDVFNRVWLLKPVVVKKGILLASPDAVRAFIHDYKPPTTMYNSPALARLSNTEKFDCVEFANDLVAKATSNNIASEVVGILFENRTIGHACVAFPTSDGGVLYYDSTPPLHRISKHAYESHVEVGQPYRRADGGTLGDGVGLTPISDVIPVSSLAVSPPHFEDPPQPIVLTPDSTFIVQSEDRIRAPRIHYQGTNGFTVSKIQLEQWNKTVAAIQEKEKNRQDAETKEIDDESSANLARVLRDTERAAAEGDAFAELRMGQRYVTGDGVPKDIDQARKYLRVAALDGSPTAVDELLRLPQ